MRLQSRLLRCTPGANRSYLCLRGARFHLEAPSLLQRLGRTRTVPSCGCLLTIAGAVRGRVCRWALCAPEEREANEAPAAWARGRSASLLEVT
jgi:hypothetical protein